MTAPSSTGSGCSIPGWPPATASGRYATAPRQPTGTQRRDGDKDDSPDREFPHNLAQVASQTSRDSPPVAEIPLANSQPPSAYSAAAITANATARRSRIGIPATRVPRAAAGNPCP